MAFEHQIDSERCKGCGLCVHICPKKVLAMTDQVNAKGHFPAHQAHPEDCIFCGLCCTMCPDIAITITEVKEATGKSD